MNKRYFLAVLASIVFFSGCNLAKNSQNQPEESASAGVSTEEAADTNNSISDGYVEIGEEFDLPVLGFHHIGPAPAGASEGVRTWYVSAPKFEQWLSHIVGQGYKPILASELIDGIEKRRLPKNAILVTFDDGPIDFYTYAWPILKKYNVKATMFLQSHVRSRNWLNDDQIKELNESELIEFQSHTKYHAYMTRISEAEGMNELVGSKEKIESIIEKPVEALAYPFGLYNKEVQRWVENAGYKVAFTIDGTSTQNINSPMGIHRYLVYEYSPIEKFLPKLGE